MGKDCKEKKCKKNCQTITVYYDRATVSIAAPVQDVYGVVAADQSYSVFIHSPIYSDSALTAKYGTAESNNKVLQNSTTNPVELPQVVSDVTVFLYDGKTSISFKYFYIASSLLPNPPPGSYKSVCYSSTGVYFDKTCYVTLNVPSTGSLWTIELKSCDRKSCA